MSFAAISIVSKVSTDLCSDGKYPRALDNISRTLLECFDGSIIYFKEVVCNT